MKKIIVLSFFIIAACRKEMTEHIVTTETSANIITAEPFMQKTVVYRYGKYKDSALLQLPVGYNADTAKYPLLIFFHGTGEAVNDGGLKKLIKIGPPKYISDSIRLGNFITLCPQDDDGYRTAANINDVINGAVKQYRVDTTRIYLTGLSAGARNITNYITEKPEYAQRIAAVVPMSIIYMDEAHIRNFKYFADYNIHCKIYCGDSDTRYLRYNVAYSDSINTFRQGQSDFVTYAGAHSGWNNPYKPTKKGNNNVYMWLCKYSK